MKYLLIITSFFMFYSCSNQNLECGDLLEKYAEKPQKIEFIECTKGTGQIVLEADYKVLGKDSEEIEEYLIKKYGIGKLKFVCCGWESTNGKNGCIENKELKMINPNYVLAISMFGNAEMKNDAGEIEIETDRTNIDYIVTVQLLDI